MLPRKSAMKVVELGQDQICRGGPDERFAMAVIVIDEAVDAGIKCLTERNDPHRIALPVISS